MWQKQRQDAACPLLLPLSVASLVTFSRFPFSFALEISAQFTHRGVADIPQQFAFICWPNHSIAAFLLQRPDWIFTPCLPPSLCCPEEIRLISLIDSFGLAYRICFSVSCFSPFSAESDLACLLAQTQITRWKLWRPFFGMWVKDSLKCGLKRVFLYRNTQICAVIKGRDTQFGMRIAFSHAQHIIKLQLLGKVLRF